jgi:uncharacterized small protein (DUF1192 family)
MNAAQIQALETLLQQYKGGSILIDEFTEKLKKQVNMSDEAAKALARYIEVHKKNSQQLEEEIKILQRMGETTEANVAILQKEIAQIEEEIQTKKASGSATDAYIAKKRKEIEQREQDIESIRNVQRATQDFIVTSIGVDDRWKNTLIGSILSGNKNKNIQAFAETAKKQLSFDNIVGSTFLKIQEATVIAFTQTDSAISSFAAATGATAEYNKVIFETARGNTNLGISFTDAGKAVTDLYTNLNTFSTLSKSAQAELTVTTAKLEKLGISGNETAGSIMTLSEMMQISETQAANVVEEFAAMGQAIGVSSKQMVSDFVGVKEQIAVFGSEMGRVFTDLAAQSKATGVAVSDLLNLTNKFDTFGSAANQVGKLNAILGGPYLSTMAMIENTDPTERINMLREAVDNAGISFENMSYYEKKAIMEAGGFKSVEEAQRVLSMSSGQYASQLENQRATQEELNNAIQRAQPIQQKLEMLMANFAVTMGPVVEGLSFLISKLLWLIDNVPFLGTILGVIVTAFVALKIVAGISGMFTTLATALGLVGPAAATAGPAVVGAATAIEGASATLAAASPIIVEGAAALGILALAFLGVGLSILFMGGAIYLAGLGMKMMLEGLASLIKEAINAPQIFLNMAAGILALSIAIATMANPITGLGMLVLVRSIHSISDAINSIETEKVVNFKVMMEKIVEISEPTAALQFSQFKEDFQAVAEATAKFEIDKANSFTNLLTATQNLSQNLQLKQDIKVMIDGREVAARIERTINGVPLATAIGR